MFAVALSLCVALAGGDDFQLTLKNATGADFWIEMVPGPAPEARTLRPWSLPRRKQFAQIYRDVDHFKEIFPQMSESRVTARVGRIITAHIAVFIVGWKGMGKIPLSGDIRQIEQHDGASIVFHQRLAGGPSEFQELRDRPPHHTAVGQAVSGGNVGRGRARHSAFVPTSLIEDENRKLVRRGVRAVRLRAAGAKFDPADL